MNKTAQRLGRMSKGKAKRITEEDRKRRIARLADARKYRWLAQKEEQT